MITAQYDKQPHLQKCILRLRGDMDKPAKVSIMEIIDREIAAIKLAEKKGNGKTIINKFVLVHRVQQVFRKFKARYANRQVELQRQMEIALLEETMRINSSGGPTEEEMMSVRATLDLCIDQYNNPADVSKLKQKANSLNYEKLFICFFDDIIAWKKKPTASSVEGKVFLINIQEIGTEKDAYFYFVDAL
jgi:hypothetical protein